MGALCQAQIDGGSSSQPLARGLDAAFAFFRTFVCATPTLHETARAMLQATMAVARRPEARAHVEEMGVAISAAFLPQSDSGFTYRRDLLQECCVWSDDKIDGKPFQRLELLGDAFLQCTRRGRPRHACGSYALFPFRCAVTDEGASAILRLRRRCVDGAA